MEILLMVIFILLGTAASVPAISARKHYGISYAKTRPLSNASKNILLKVNELPSESRPSDIYNVLKGLDIREGKNDVNSHFRKTGYHGSYFSWKCSCYYEGCKYHEYRDINNLVTGVMDAVEKQKKLLQTAGIKPGYESLIENLRQEQKLINQVTNEIEGA